MVDELARPIRASSAMRETSWGLRLPSPLLGTPWFRLVSSFANSYDWVTRSVAIFACNCTVTPNRWFETERDVFRRYITLQPNREFIYAVTSKVHSLLRKRSIACYFINRFISISITDNQNAVGLDLLPPKSAVGYEWRSSWTSPSIVFSSPPLIPQLLCHVLQQKSKRPFYCQHPYKG
jgi:hypothetical protein